MVVTVTKVDFSQSAVERMWGWIDQHGVNMYHRCKWYRLAVLLVIYAVGMMMDTIGMTHSASVLKFNFGSISVRKYFSKYFLETSKRPSSMIEVVTELTINHNWPIKARFTCLDRFWEIIPPSWILGRVELVTFAVHGTWEVTYDAVTLSGVSYEPKRGCALLYRRQVSLFSLSTESIFPWVHTGSTDGPDDRTRQK